MTSEEKRYQSSGKILNDKEIQKLDRSRDGRLQTLLGPIVILISAVLLVVGIVLLCTSEAVNTNSSFRAGIALLAVGAIALLFTLMVYLSWLKARKKPSEYALELTMRSGISQSLKIKTEIELNPVVRSDTFRKMGFENLSIGTPLSQVTWVGKDKLAVSVLEFKENPDRPDAFVGTAVVASNLGYTLETPVDLKSTPRALDSSFDSNFTVEATKEQRDLLLTPKRIEGLLELRTECPDGVRARFFSSEAVFLLKGYSLGIKKIVVREGHGIYAATYENSKEAGTRLATLISMLDLNRQ